MNEWLQPFQSSIQQFVDALEYIGIALLMLVESVFPPIPSELVMPFGGFLASTGRLSLGAVVLAGTLGSTAGALALYYIGRQVGEDRVRRFLHRYGRYLHFSERDLEHVARFFNRHGDTAVLIGRLLPLVRSLVSLPAGMCRMPVGRFLFYTALGTMLWNTLLAGTGFFLGESWHRVPDVIQQYEWLLVGIVIAGAVLLLLFRRYSRRREADKEAGRR